MDLQVNSWHVARLRTLGIAYRPNASPLLRRAESQRRNHVSGNDGALTQGRRNVFHMHAHTLGSAACCGKLGSVSGSAVTSLRPRYAKKGRRQLPNPQFTLCERESGTPSRFGRSPSSVPGLAGGRSVAGQRDICRGRSSRRQEERLLLLGPRGGRTGGGGNQDAQEDVVTPPGPPPSRRALPGSTLPLCGEPPGACFERRCKLALARPARVPDPLALLHGPVLRSGAPEQRHLEQSRPVSHVITRHHSEVERRSDSSAALAVGWA